MYRLIIDAFVYDKPILVVGEHEREAIMKMASKMGIYSIKVYLFSEIAKQIRDIKLDNYLISEASSFFMNIVKDSMN